MNSTNILLENLQIAIAQTTDRLASSAAKKADNANGNASFKKLLDQKTQTGAEQGKGEPAKTELPAQDTITPEQESPVNAQVLAAAMMMQPMVVLMEENSPTAAQALQSLNAGNNTVPTIKTPQPLAVAQAETLPTPANQEANVPVIAAQIKPEVIDPAAENALRQQPVTASQETAKPVETIASTQDTVPLQQVAAKQVEQKEEQPLQGDFQPVFRELEHLPVKVAEAPPAVDTQAPDMEAQLAKQISKACESGETKLKIALSPETFGTVTIEMAHMQDGTLRLLMTASTERGQTLLEKHASGLQGMLAESNRAPVQVEVQRQSESQWTQHSYDRESGGGQQQQQQRQQQHSQNQDFLDRLRLGLTERESFTL